MAILGPNDLKQVALPGTWDATALRNFQLRSGQDYLSVLRDINDMLTLAGQSVMSGPLFDLVYQTQERTVEYRVGTSKAFEDHTEYGTPDSQRAATTGHMLPLKKKDHRLGWTADFLENARQTQIDADVAASAQAYADVLEQAILTRLFKSTADSGAKNGLGSSGKSVPWADGGTADSTFIPVQMPARGLTSPANTHTHFLRLNGLTQTNLETAIDHLWEHGHDAPYDLLVSSADLGSWQNTSNVTGFVPRNYGLVAYGNNTALAQVGDKYEGVITTKRGPVRLWSNGRIPTTYWTVYKSYGRNDRRNPLWMCVDPIFGTGPKLIVENVSLYPLAGAIVQAKFGVGVGEDRTSAVAVLNASSGSYSDPTIA